MKAQTKSRRIPIANSKKVLLVVAFALGSAALALFAYREFALTLNPEFSCPDGIRRRIDPREFESKHWAYSAKLAAKLGKQAAVEFSAAPTVIKQLSDALYQSDQARKLLVHSYNSCAITSHAFQASATTIQRLDAIASTLLVALESPSDKLQSEAMNSLIDAYVQAARKLDGR